MLRFGSVLFIATTLVGDFAAAQSATTSLARDRFSGVYELSPTHFIYIRPWPGSGNNLLYTDDAHQVRELYPESAYAFTAGPGVRVPAPVALRITFVEDSRGQVTALKYQVTGKPPRTAKRVASYRREEVNFRSGGEYLAGTLLLPPGKGPHPALVLIHGSGPADRNTVLPIAQFLLRYGVALLAYDKRGVGASTGNWQSASLEELAGDALAAADLLKRRNDIDGKRIGLFGASQGGWVAPLAATRSSDVAFLISVSGPAVSPAQVTLDRAEHSMRREGFSEGEIAEALAIVRLRDQVARGQQSLQTLASAIEQVRGKKWFPYTSLPRSTESWLPEHWNRAPLDYDPAPVLAALRVPVLALFGALDQNVMPEKNAGKWREALQRGNVNDYTIRVLPRANHMLFEAQTGLEEEYNSLARFVPEFREILVRWLRDRRILRP